MVASVPRSEGKYLRITVSLTPCFTLLISACYRPFVADIANPDLFVGPGFVAKSPAFMMSTSHRVGPHAKFE